MSIGTELERITGARDDIATALDTFAAGAKIDQCAGRLEELREELAENLTLMGVEADTSETVAELVSKVLSIPQGDTSQIVFNGTVAEEFPVSFGYFETGDTASFQNMCSITAICRITELRITVTGDYATEIQINGEGWEETKDMIPMSGINQKDYETGGHISKFEAQTAFNNINIIVSVEGAGSFTVKPWAISDTGETFELETVELVYRSKTTWAALEARELTMADLAAMTWAELEGLGKPDE